MKRPIILLVGFLLVIPAALITFRILFLGYPLIPAAPKKTWQLSMETRIRGEENQTTLTIALPYSDGGQRVVEEKITSGKLTFNLLREGANQVGVWSGRVGKGEEIIGYQATLLVQSQRPSTIKPPMLEPYPGNISKEVQTLAGRLVARWNNLEPRDRLRAIAASCRGIWGDPLPDNRDLKAWSSWQDKYGRVTALLVLLRAVGLPARAVEGLLLTEGITTIAPNWIDVWTGKDWESMSPWTGKIYEKPTSLLSLATDGLPLVRIVHGEVLDIQWSLKRQIISQWHIHFERIRQSSHLLDRWSLFYLPSEFQETFRILLLVPIGALMICILRNLVGFPTFGIFMPVLMALAFRNTGLIYGVGIFAGFILIGYAARRSMDKLRLLLVPRLSVLLTLVIVFFTAIALFGSKLGLRELMAVGLLPFVILTMTIERFFILMEEAGVHEGFRTAVGTAVVSAITHEILHWEALQLTFFVYPELLFAVAATQVLLGRYTGYRLLEFLRFRKFRGSS